MLQPRPYQKEAVEAVLEARSRGVTRQLISLPTGCHETGTRILMFDGSVKNVEDINVGEKLMGPDSKPREVLRTIHGYGKMFRINPTKGDPFVVNEDHILSLEKTNERADLKRVCPSTCRKRVNVSVREYLDASANFKHLHKLYRCGVVFPGKDQELFPLSPYFLGVLLGDGGFAHGTVMVTTPDAEIVEECFAQARKHVLDIRIEEMRGNKAKNYHFVTPEGKKCPKKSNRIRESLRELGLLGKKCSEKFVPIAYKVASAEDRLQILAGLLDTDGSLSNNVFEFSSKSEQLADDVAFLSRSLGLAAYKAKKIVKGKEYQRVSIFGEVSAIPTRVPRKKAAPRKQKKSCLVTAFKVEPVGEGEYFGFELDSDRLYLMGDFTVTHNSGKTVVFSMLAKELSRKTLVIAHREELLEQAWKKMHMVYPEARLGLVRGKRNEIEADVVLTSVQTASQTKRLETLRRSGFELMIVDEAHHASAASYRKVIGGLGFSSGDPSQLLVGVTATAFRGDRKSLGDVFEEIAFERTIMAMIRGGYLCDAVGKSVETEIDLSDVRTAAGDFQVNELAFKINVPERNDLVAKGYLEHCEGRKAVVFCADVQHAKDMAEAFGSHGIPVATIWGNMASEDRKQTLQDFSRGRYQVLTNCAVLTEGFDDPSIAAVMLARPTKSPGLYTQMVGRGLRTYPGKRDCLVIDFGDNMGRHKLCTLATLVGSEMKVREGESLSKAVERTEREKEEAGNVRILGHSTEIVELFERSRFVWTQAKEHFSLTIDGGQRIWLKCVAPDAYEVLVYAGRGELVETLSGEPLPLGYAQGMAEDHVRLKGSRMASRTAQWRQKPASTKQKNYMTNLGISFGEHVTAGEASELIDRKEAAKTVMALDPATANQLKYLRWKKIPIPEGCSKKQASQLIMRHKKSERAVV